MRLMDLSYCVLQGDFENAIELQQSYRQFFRDLLRVYQLRL